MKPSTICSGLSPGRGACGQMRTSAPVPPLAGLPTTFTFVFAGRFTQPAVASRATSASSTRTARRNDGVPVIADHPSLLITCYASVTGDDVMHVAVATHLAVT